MTTRVPVLVRHHVHQELLEKFQNAFQCQKCMDLSQYLELGEMAKNMHLFCPNLYEFSSRRCGMTFSLVVAGLTRAAVVATAATASSSSSTAATATTTTTATSTATSEWSTPAFLAILVCVERESTFVLSVTWWVWKCTVWSSDFSKCAVSNNTVRKILHILHGLCNMEVTELLVHEIKNDSVTEQCYCSNLCFTIFETVRYK